MEDFGKRVESLGIKESKPKAFEALVEILNVLRIHGLSNEDSGMVLDLLSDSGRKEVLNYPMFVEDNWGDFEYGNTKPGDYVRIKPHSYDSSVGIQHNGRVGKITNISGRRVQVRYLGIRGSSNMDHPITNLQSPKYGLQWNTDQK